MKRSSKYLKLLGRPVVVDANAGYELQEVPRDLGRYAALVGTGTEIMREIINSLNRKDLL